VNFLSGSVLEGPCGEAEIRWVNHRPSILPQTYHLTLY